MTRPALAIVAAALGAIGCGDFEDENIVIDTRILAMKATVPDQIVDVDLMNPQRPVELLEQLVPSRMCALVADPAFDRRIRWSMTLCVLSGDERCASVAMRKLASGVAADPELAVPPSEMCATIQPDGNLLGILLEALEGDVFSGLGGLDYGISLVVGGEGVDPALDLYAGKTLRVAPRIPAGRRENTNPHVERFEAEYIEGEPFDLPRGRCIEQAAPLELPAGTTMRITPIEPDGVRELYVVPTLDGMEQQFTESLTYQWLASAGGFSAGSTGGPRDVAGNPAPLFTDFIAPRAKDLDGPTDVHLWIVQRDERLGAEWYESCVRVVP